MNRRLAVRMQRTGECRGKAGQSGELRAGGPRARIAPSRMAPMDGAAPWMHPHGRTDGAIQGINLIWEVPGNQPNPEQHMMQERIMAPAEMTASRYISQPRLLMVRASRGQAKAAVAAGTVVSAKMTAARKEAAASQAGAVNTRPNIRPNTSLTRLCTRKRTIWQRHLWSWGFFLCAVSVAVCCSALCSEYSASYLPLCQKKETEWTVRQRPDLYSPLSVLLSPCLSSSSLLRLRCSLSYRN